MARQRDYAAEYERRQEIARDLGYGSYHQRRQTSELADRLELDREGRRELERLSKEGGSRLSPAEVRQRFREGADALRRKDHEQAEAIARQLGYRPTRNGPARRVFWYH